MKVTKAVNTVWQVTLGEFGNTQDPTKPKDLKPKNLPVYEVELEINFPKSGVIIDLPEDENPTGKSRRFILPLISKDFREEEDGVPCGDPLEVQLRDRMGSCLHAYQEVGFDMHGPGPEQPPPKGIFVHMKAPDGDWYAMAVTGYQNVTTKDMNLIAPLTVL